MPGQSGGVFPKESMNYFMVASAILYVGASIAYFLGGNWKMAVIAFLWVVMDAIYATMK